MSSYGSSSSLYASTSRMNNGNLELIRGHRNCRCGMKEVLWTSWSDLNPQRKLARPGNEGPVKIQFIRDGYEVLTPTDLPVKPPGLKWKGKDCLTSSHLEGEREAMIGNMQRRASSAADIL